MKLTARCYYADGSSEADEVETVEVGGVAHAPLLIRRGKVSLELFRITDKGTYVYRVPPPLKELPSLEVKPKSFF